MTSPSPHPANTGTVSPPPPPVPRRPLYWHWALAVLAPLGTVIFLQLLQGMALPIPTPGIVLLLAVVLASFVGGIGPGLVSAAVAVVYVLLFAWMPGQRVTYVEVDFQRAYGFAAASLAMVVMVGLLRHRVDRLAAERAARIEAERSQQRLKSLYEATAQITQGLAIESVLDTIIRTARALFAADHAIVYLCDESGRYLCPALYGRSRREDRATCPLCSVQQLCDGSGALPPSPAVEGVFAEARNAPVCKDLNVDGMGSVLVAPLDIGGYLVISYKGLHQCTSRELQEASVLASQASIALQHARMYQEARSQALEVEALYNAAQRIRRSVDLKSTLESIVDTVVQVTGSDIVVLALADAGGKTLRYETTRGIPPSLVEDYVLQPGVGLMGLAAQTGAVVRSPDLAQDPRVSERGKAIARATGAQSALIVPLRDQQRMVGALAAFSRQLAYFDPAQEERLRRLAEAAALAIVHAREVAERQQAEEQLRQAQKMEAVSQLAGGVAHDLNNLLTVITGFSEILLSRLDPADRNRSAIEQIQKAAEGAASITRQLLTFSRQQIITPRPLDLNTLVTGMEDTLRRLLGEDIQMAMVLQPSLWQVNADPSQMQQVLVNLAANARDAMPHGGTLTVMTENMEVDDESARRHPGLQAGPYVVLTVTDTGNGMDAETLSRIFEPFFTTKERSRGTGLGLATVYGIVTQSNGYIDVQSGPGRGTTFRIYLPRHDDGPPPEQTGHQMAGPAPGRATVLLVEDEPMVRALAQHVLESNGYTVLVAEGGAKAVKLAQEYAGQIHLLLTDMVMPGLSGRELADRLTVQRPDLKVLYMSGYTQDVLLRQGLEDQTITFLQKPFTPTALIQKVRQALGGPL